MITSLFYLYFFYLDFLDFSRQKKFSNINWIWYFYKKLEPYGRINLNIASAQNPENFRLTGFGLEGDIKK